MVARPEEDGPRRVGFHADRAQDAVLERLLLELDLAERVSLGLLALEAGRGRCRVRAQRVAKLREIEEEERRAGTAASGARE